MSGSNENAGETIDIGSLPVQQLQVLRQQTEEELEFLAQSHSQLVTAQKRFKQSATTLSALQPENKDKEILVPLTSSLYVKGRMSNVEKLIVDVGTGYFAEKDVEASQEYFDRRIAFLQKNIDEISEALQMKRAVYSMITEALQAKIQEIASQQPVKAGK